MFKSKSKRGMFSGLKVERESAVLVTGSTKKCISKLVFSFMCIITFCFVCVLDVFPHSPLRALTLHILLDFCQITLDIRHILSLVAILGGFRVKKKTILIVNTQQGKRFEKPGYPRSESVVFGS